MKVIPLSFLGGILLLGCASEGSKSLQPPVSDVSLLVEVLEYRVDDSRTWGTDSAGKDFEWHYDTFRFRVLEPEAYRGQEWQIMLPFSIEKEHLARIPDPKAKISIRIHSDALKTIVDPSRPADMSRWPTLHSQYVFSEKKEPNQSAQPTRGKAPRG